MSKFISIKSVRIVLAFVLLFFFIQTEAVGQTTVAKADTNIVSKSSVSDNSVNPYEVVDTASGIVSNSKSVIDTINTVLKDKKYADASPDLVKLLDSLGLEGGWAKQIGKLKKISGKLDIIEKVLKHGNTAVQLSEAYSAGDREKFTQIIADTMIDVVAGIAGGLAGKLFYSRVPGAIAAAIVTGGWSIIAAPGLIVGGYIAEDQTKQFVTSLLKKHAYELLTAFGGKIYDVVNGMMTQDSDSIEEGLLPSTEEGGNNSGNNTDQGAKPVMLDKLKVIR